MEKNIDFLFNNVPLYAKQKFQVFELKEDIYEMNEKEISAFIKYIGVNKDKLVTYCHKCKKEIPFNVEKECSKLERDINFNYCMVITKNPKSPGTPSLPGKINISRGILEGLQPPYNKNIL